MTVQMELDWLKESGRIETYYHSVLNVRRRCQRSRLYLHCANCASFIPYCNSSQYSYKIKNWDVTWCASCDMMFQGFHDAYFLFIKPVHLQPQICSTPLPHRTASIWYILSIKPVHMSPQICSPFLHTTPEFDGNASFTSHWQMSNPQRQHHLITSTINLFFWLSYFVVTVTTWHIINMLQERERKLPPNGKSVTDVETNAKVVVVWKFTICIVPLASISMFQLILIMHYSWISHPHNPHHRMWSVFVKVLPQKFSTDWLGPAL